MTADLSNDWRDSPITRDPRFRNRLVGSLSVDELRYWRSNWMAWAKDFWGSLDADALTLYRALERANAHHGLELSESSSPQAAKRKEGEEKPTELPIVTPAPQQKPLPVREAQAVPGMPSVPPLASKDIVPVENQLSNAPSDPPTGEPNPNAYQELQDVKPVIDQGKNPYGRNVHYARLRAFRIVLVG
jgi:hypothetical protein